MRYAGPDLPSSSEALGEVAASADLAALDEARVRWLGKKGTLTEQLKALGGLPAAERPAAGQRINEAKERVQARHRGAPRGARAAPKSSASSPPVASM